jgi:hypothetical protein
LINGKNIKIFVDRDLKNIRKIIESATQNNTEAVSEKSKRKNG